MISNMNRRVVSGGSFIIFQCIAWYILILAIPLVTSAHENKQYEWNYDNIKIRFETGLERSEEVYKLQFIGEYSAMLVEKLDYTKPILLDYIHDYTNSMEAASFIASDSGGYYAYWGGEMHNKMKNYDDIHLVVRQIDYSFDIMWSLQLLEYAIKNEVMIKKKMEHVQYPDCMDDHYIFNSIPMIYLTLMLKNEPSESIINILSKQLLRSEKEIEARNYLSYMTRDNRYYLYRNNFGEIELLDTDPFENIYRFIRVGNLTAFVFQTFNEFRFISHTILRIVVSRWHTIDSLKYEYYVNIYINPIAFYEYLVYHESLFQDEEERTLYLADEDIVIDKFDNIINELRKK
jgi:hypothetical protein